MSGDGRSVRPCRNCGKPKYRDGASCVEERIIKSERDREGPPMTPHGGNPDYLAGWDAGYAAGLTQGREQVAAEYRASEQAAARDAADTEFMAMIREKLTDLDRRLGSER